MSDCPFCEDNWTSLDIVADLTNIEGHRLAIINPLDPVTSGHVLVICGKHTSDAAADPRIAGQLVRAAAWYVRGANIQANIITSIGEYATQTVKHTHVHVVPRREGDELPLPWTPQHMRKTLEMQAAMQRVIVESGGGDWSGLGLFQQQPTKRPRSSIELTETSTYHTIQKKVPVDIESIDSLEWDPDFRCTDLRYKSGKRLTVAESPQHIRTLIEEARR